MKLNAFFIKMKEQVIEPDILIKQLVKMSANKVVRFDTPTRTVCYGIVVGDRYIVTTSTLTPCMSYDVTFCNGAKAVAKKVKISHESTMSVFKVPICPKVNSIRRYNGSLEKEKMLFVMNNDEFWYAECASPKTSLPKFHASSGFDYLTDKFAGSLILTKNAEVVGITHGFAETDNNLWIGFHINSVMGATKGVL